jgi:8-oxo-dGTP pyrophosphatase MutT (NUDIX family)
MMDQNNKNSSASRASAGGIVLNSEGKIVLVRQHQNSWSFPKGGLEPGESELEAARREIFEEAGLKDIELLQKDVLGSYERYSIGIDGVSEQKEWGLRKRTFFLFKTRDDTLNWGHDDEVTDARWVSIDEALQLLTHPKDKTFLQSVREKIEKAK